ncbi:lysoplasmalogenase [Paeniglutamicibacter sp. NPDC091659]|uniref:lysoplasmalogenase n=1 Tax=Paeniglutamicibacter sp. NPDC091659 TaxID=3364389 RepID=UPI0038214CA1
MLTLTGTERVPRWPYVPFAILTVVHLYGQAAGDVAVADWTKTWLMLALLLAFLISAPRSNWLAIALGATALVGSGLGDNSDLGGSEFLRGLGAFAVAHLSYIVLFSWGLGLRPRNAAKWTLLYVPLLIFVLSIVLPHAGGMAPAVATYALLILTMAILGGCGNRATALGSALFVISDSVLSLDLFVPGFHFWQIDLLIMGTYTIGQGLIVHGVVQKLRERSAVADSPISPGAEGAYVPK